MSDAPRVLHVMWQMSIGGAERAVYQLVREQRLRAIEADVAVGNGLGLYGDRARDAGALVHELRCRGALDIRRSSRLTRVGDDYQIVHHHGIEPLLIAASTRARTPRLVYTHRGGVRDHGWRKQLRLRSVRPKLRRFAALSANTRQSARVLAAYLGISEAQISVVFNGIDFDLLEPFRSRDEVMAELPASARDAFVVGTASKLQPLKRVHLLLEALASLRDRRFHGVILGDGPSRRGLEELSIALGLGERVSFLGQKEHIGDYLQLMDAFVLPSGPQEAFGNAAVEAIGVGVPTVVFADGGGLTEHMTDRATGLVVDDVTGLSEALAELARDEHLRHRLSKQGRRHARSKYSLYRMAEHYGELYEKALAGPP